MKYTHLKESSVRYLCFILIVLFLNACSEENPAVVERSWGEMKGLESLVGNMSDTSYSHVLNMPPRLNALGEEVPIALYEGKYLWAEYAASWCKTCQRQAPQVRQVQARYSSDVNFITIMTGKSTAYNDHATVQTAKEWARRHQLDPQHVLSARLWYKTIPEHRLFSPEGHTLFVHVGYLDAWQISDIIQYYKKDYEAYKTYGTYADWMH